jgi:hypothetical protein
MNRIESTIGLENTPNGIFWKMPFFIKEKKILEREEKG